MTSRWQAHRLRLLLMLLVFALIALVGFHVFKEHVDLYAWCIQGRCLPMTEDSQRHFFGRVPRTVAHTCQDPDMYAMTFDDGPTPNWDELLRLLKREKIPATFFVNGRHLDSREDQARLRTAYADGHQISNHTTHHLNLLEANEGVVAFELNDTYERIVAILGHNRHVESDARIVRPPYGFIDANLGKIIDKHGYRAVRYNVDVGGELLKAGESGIYLKRFRATLDFIRSDVVKDYNRSILDLNHDSSRATLDAIPNAIRMIRREGYRFVTVRECIGNP